MGSETAHMRVLLQRVSCASVAVDGVERGAVGLGFLALVGITHEDDAAAARKLAAKTARLRVFADDAGLMNLALGDVGGEVLAVSQFTLYADTRRGNRPSFTDAAPPETGEALYETYVEALRAEGVPVQTGVFGAHMQVDLVNDGPVTILLEGHDRAAPGRPPQIHWGGQPFTRARVYTSRPRARPPATLWSGERGGAGRGVFPTPPGPPPPAPRPSSRTRRRCAASERASPPAARAHDGARSSRRRQTRGPRRERSARLRRADFLSMSAGESYCLTDFCSESRRRCREIQASTHGAAQ